MDKLPECSNKKCINKGMIMFQGGFYCSECWQRIQDYMDNKQKEAMEAVFQ